MWGVVNMTSLSSRESIRLAREARHGPELQERFSAASVAVCGLGGLGSNLALCLARAGVGRLHLIDFDRVDLSNLHRQQYFTPQLGRPKTEALRDILAAAAPDVTVTIHTARVTEDNLDALLADCRIVCEAFDTPEDKALLVNAVLERFPDKYVVAASGMAGLGPANEIRHPPHHPPFLPLRRRDQPAHPWWWAPALPGDALRRPPGPRRPPYSGGGAGRLNITLKTQ